jgi:nucleotide-binding universal stress UspA family protein
MDQNTPSPPLPSFDQIAAFWPTSQGALSPTTSRKFEEEISRQAKEEESSGKALLTQSLETLEASGLGATRLLVRGDAATEIIKHVETHKIDLILAGSRGLSQVKGWFLGSVSRKLVHYAGCSVLVVKSPITGGSFAK